MEFVSERKKAREGGSKGLLKKMDKKVRKKKLMRKADTCHR